MVKSGTCLPEITTLLESRLSLPLSWKAAPFLKSGTDRERINAPVIIRCINANRSSRQGHIVMKVAMLPFCQIPCKLHSVVPH